MRALGALSFMVAAGLLASAPVARSAPDGGVAPSAALALVGDACRARAAGLLDNLRVTVDPVGSRRFGFALLSGIEPGTDNARSVICVYDTANKQAEIGTLLDLDTAGSEASDFPAGTEAPRADVPATLIYPNAPRCGQSCLAAWTGLTPDDQDELSDLPEQVRRTLADIPSAGETPAVARARAAARSVVAAAGGHPDAATAPDLSGVSPGRRSCAVFRFGFMDRGAEEVGTHPCRVDRLSNGGLNLVKTAGESLTMQIQMLGEGLAVGGGRTAEAGPPVGGYDLARPVDRTNPNFGNKAGLAIAATDGQLFVVSIGERGIQPKDPTFFEVIAVGTPAAGG